jgi:hypothetical protein
MLLVWNCSHLHRVELELKSCLFAVIFCPALKAPVNGTLSSPDVVYGSVVYGQCYQGFMFPGGSVIRPVQCIDNTTALDNVINGLLLQGTMWNDTLPDCQRNYC